MAQQFKPLNVYSVTVIFFENDSHIDSPVQTCRVASLCTHMVCGLKPVTKRERKTSRSLCQVPNFLGSGIFYQRDAGSQNEVWRTRIKDSSTWYLLELLVVNGTSLRLLLKTTWTLSTKLLSQVLVYLRSTKWGENTLSSSLKSIK